MRHTPDNPSLTPEECIIGCGRMTTTGACAACAQDLFEDSGISVDDAVRWLETGEATPAIDLWLASRKS